jgi:hypothetical protein
MAFRIADTFPESRVRLSGEEQKAVKIAAFDLQNPVKLCHACCDAQSQAWHDDVPSHGGARGRAYLMNSQWRYALETGIRPAIQSTTRSPIMTTVAWAPPDLGIRGITDASTTHNPWMPLTLQY